MIPRVLPLAVRYGLCERGEKLRRVRIAEAAYEFGFTTLEEYRGPSPELFKEISDAVTILMNELMDSRCALKGK